MTRTLATLTLLLACSNNEPAQEPPTFSVLVFSRTTGFRHTSIDPGIQAIRALGSSRGFTVEATEGAAAFTDQNLSRFNVIVFLSTTGDVLDNNQQAAMERYIKTGGGFVGIHSASDTEYDWPWYGRLVGAYFDSHPAVQLGLVRSTTRSHPSTRGISAISRTDEWYNFRDDPSSRGAMILLLLDETSYEGGTMGVFHPISWFQIYDGGRSWYTAMGHTDQSWSEIAFLEHVAGGIRWAAGLDQ